MTKAKYSQMVCLVGENPLPVYLGIKQYAEGTAKIDFVGSPDVAGSANEGTERIARRLMARLAIDDKANGTSRLCTFVPIENPFSPQSVRNVLASLAPTANTRKSLNMTGGTKVMAAYSVAEWNRAGADRDIIYLAERDGKFWFGENVSEAMAPHGMTAADMCALHGIEFKKDNNWQPDPTWDDLRNILRAFIKSSDARAALRRSSRSDQGQPNTTRAEKHIPTAVEFPYFSRDEDSEPSRNEKAFADFTKDKDQYLHAIGLLTEKTREAWLAFESPQQATDFEISECKKIYSFFAANQWFEYLVRGLMRRVPKSPSRLRPDALPADPAVDDTSVLFSQEFTVGPPANTGNKARGGYDANMFEGDILTVTNGRLRYISVTTSWHAAACKEKMFEAMHRSRQIGGDLASSCVVSLAESSTVKGCRASVDEQPRHTLYGKDDVYDWVVNGDLTTLREFLIQDF